MTRSFRVLPLLALALLIGGCGDAPGDDPSGAPSPVTSSAGRYFPDAAPWYQDISGAPTTRNRAR